MTGEPGSALLVVGIGARRGVPAEAVRRALALIEVGGPRLYASVDAKAAEPGILAAIAPQPLHTRPAAALAAVAGTDPGAVPRPGHPRVEAETGSPSVAEAAALVVAREHDPGARLVVPKIVAGQVTVAAALARYPVSPDPAGHHHTAGRACGEGP